ncbi:hypothetical protein BV898_13755 [Hypsibius exemplaris]|uniref:Receptor ligand binding region domain-containing protein n=1 Tax=Hypsibius exemplaris TaxID=2072580 RepID=A0A1W0W9V5_HYPEX|nr:hypothetical protein BV898_13755 [Hypsibius exemplaris]
MWSMLDLASIWTLLITMPAAVLSIMKMEIAVFLPYNIPSLPSSIVLTGPAFDLAAENTNKMYHGQINISITYLYNKELMTCDGIAAQSVQRISEYFYRNTTAGTCYATVMSACVDQSGMASIARGSPTGIALAGTLQGYATAVLDILADFDWFHASIILEANTTDAPFYRDVGKLLYDSAREAPKFTVELFSLDTTSRQTIKMALDLAKERSRVFIFLCVGKTTVRLLNLAERFGLTNGEYVFVNLHSMQLESYGTTAQFQKNPFDNNLIAFRSLLFITYRPADETSVVLRKLNHDIALRTGAPYNQSYQGGLQPLDSFFIQTSYDLVGLFAKTLIETRERDRVVLCSGQRLARALTNRTFDLATGEMFIDAKRARNLDLNIFAFNTTTGNLQVTGTYEWAKSARLTWSKELLMEWPTKDGRPPPDVPVCGFSGREGACAAQANFVRTATATGVVLAIVLVTFFVCLSRWIAAKSNDLGDNWWIVNRETLITHDRRGPSNNSTGKSVSLKYKLCS